MAVLIQLWGLVGAVQHTPAQTQKAQVPVVRGQVLLAIYSQVLSHKTKPRITPQLITTAMSTALIAIVTASI